MSDEVKKVLTLDSDTAMASADVNGDGHVSKGEEDMYLEFKRKELEDQDAMRDAKRAMTWFSLRGMILYPAVVLAADYAGLANTVTTLGGMAAVYFASTAAIVMAYFGADAYVQKK